MRTESQAYRPGLHQSLIRRRYAQGKPEKSAQTAPKGRMWDTYDQPGIDCQSGHFGPVLEEEPQLAGQGPGHSSGQNPVDDMPMHICQAAVNAVVTDRQAFVVDAQQVKNRGVDVVHLSRVVSIQWLVAPFV